jgi:hypothetical protein
MDQEEFIGDGGVWTFGRVENDYVAGSMLGESGSYVLGDGESCAFLIGFGPEFPGCILCVRISPPRSWLTSHHVRNIFI